jgi:hypothetical protein
MGDGSVLISATNDSNGHENNWTIGEIHANSWLEPHPAWDATEIPQESSILTGVDFVISTLCAFRLQIVFVTHTICGIMSA